MVTKKKKLSSGTWNLLDKWSRGNLCVCISSYFSLCFLFQYCDIFPQIAYCSDTVRFFGILINVSLYAVLNTLVWTFSVWLIVVEFTAVWSLGEQFTVCYKSQYL